MEYSVGLDWLIIIATFVITLGSQFFIKHSYHKTIRISSSKGVNGYDVARKILDSNGLSHVKIEETPTELGDHYDPRCKVVRLSTDVYRKSTIASISVAAHECGHAIQDKDGYFFLRLRSMIVPVVNLASSLGYIAIMIGLFAGAFGFLWIGIFLEVIILFFQLITLPVEFNASSRGLKQLKSLNLLTSSEESNSRGMLVAAALTYVASVATSLLEIFRLILIANSRRDD